MRMRTAATVSVFALTTFAVLAFVRHADAKEPRPGAPTEYIETLHGEWTGEAKLMANPVHTTLRWTSVLSGKFTRLELEHRAGGAEGAVIFAGHSYVANKPGPETSGTWFDSSGTVRPQAVRVDDGALIVDWGTAETEEGRSVYKLVEGDKLQVEDWVKRGEEFHPFAGGNLTRE